MTLSNMTSRRMTVTTLCVSAVLGLTVGCAGPTKKGLEAREVANAHFNAVRSRIDYDQAMQAFKRGQMLEAKRALEKAMELAPNDALYYTLLGRVYLETSQTESAINAFKESIVCNDKLPDPHYYLGIIDERLDKPDDAAARYLEAATLDPETAQYVTAAVETMIGEGRFADAESVLSQYGGRFTDSAAVHHLRGRIAMMNSKWSEAVDSLQRASLIDDEDPWLLADLARAQFAAGHHTDCLTTTSQLKGAFNDADLDREIDRLHARCLVDAHRFREAHRSLSTFTKTYSDDIEAWIDFALVCREVGDRHRLRKAATRVVSLDRSRFEGYFLLGCSFFDDGEHDDAVRCFAEATSLAPNRAHTWLALGLAYEGANKPAKAVHAYAQANSSKGRAMIAQVESLDD